jgi:hypothetical protein
LIAGGVVGNIAYAYRVEIKGNAVYVRTKVMEIANDATSKAVVKKERVKLAVSSCVESMKKKASTVSRQATSKASELRTGAKKAVSEPSLRVATASAVGGSMVLGTAGLATGATVGAAIGLVPAIFTFGLSIPVGAALGGGIGATTGGTVGFGTGGALGYGIYTKRAEIKGAAGSVKGFVKDKAQEASSAANSAVNNVRAKLSGSTGSTL